MPPKTIALESMEASQHRIAEEAATRQANTAGAHNAPGPDLTREMCCDCGEHGCFGDGEFFYCPEHAPDRFRAVYRGPMSRRDTSDG